jgi:hypothetical protein
MQDLAPGQGYADAVDGDDLVGAAGGVFLHVYRCCVEIPSATALRSAVTSASIHDW